ncbi:hypothetical protein TRFO_32041 [Tritrichomonas foetus]|uniref:DUF3447 domain-containing protein n=1 Tax=Tritrichomonas foetus TaxID=1144522 RepID=A0A1J4JQ84_9EUKA|nr:hypothetical protein TRFO_32041 [Tritrichomonas foetus]|eukprot:OHT01211.1 hypothetical protein TRFO_32041 [Tritrichomonas foetus]
MDFFLISKLGNDLSIIQNLQRLMISILSSDSQVVISELVTELFNSFTKLEISKHYSLYEIILRIFVHLSICYNFCETKDEEVISRRHEIYCMILKELISKHSLKSSFHQFTLFNIFKSNKHLLLFLVQEEIVSISFLITRFSRMSSQFLSQFSPQFTLNLFLFFIPEIKRYDRIFYEQLKEQMNLNEEDIRLAYHISNENFQDSTIEENLIEIRRKIHSEDEIAKIIRSDDLDHFIDFCSTISDFDLNSQIKSSFLEDNPDINNDEKGGISLIEYSMAFGSINIFRYLLLKDAKITIKSYSYCIIGNNYEIVHLLEEEPRLQMDDEDEMNMFEKNPFVGFGEEELDDETYNMLVDQQYSRFHEVVFHKSIEYYHPEFIEYYSPELAPLSILTIITTFNETSNIEILCELFPGNKEFTQCSEIEGSYKIAPCDITTTLFLPTVFFTIMNFEQTPIYFLYCFFFQLANININMTDDIILFT